MPPAPWQSVSWADGWEGRNVFNKDIWGTDLLFPISVLRLDTPLFRNSKWAFELLLAPFFYSIMQLKSVRYFDISSHYFIAKWNPSQRKQPMIIKKNAKANLEILFLCNNSKLG